MPEPTIVEKVEFGFENGHIAIMKDDGTYEVPVPVKGNVALALEAKGEQYTKYADNMVFFSMEANAGYAGDWTVTFLDKELEDTLLGKKKSTNGLHVEITNVVPKHFAFLGQLRTDIGKGRLCWYDCTLGRPKIDLKTTEENIETKDRVYPITIATIKVADENAVYARIDSTDTANKATYDGFFEEVVLPIWSTP